MSYPNKEQRNRCYNSRDELWKCLDTNEDNNDKCIAFRKAFETQCPLQWVTHFDRKRDFLKYKDKIEKSGFEPIDEHKSSSEQ